MRHVGVPMLFALAAASADCAEIHRTQVGTADEVVETKPEVVPSQEFEADVREAGGVITVRVRPRCMLVEQETVETTTTYEQELDDDDQVWMTFLGVGGTVPLGGGIALLADSPSVYDSNVNARLYNPTGQDAAVGVGTLLTIAGTAMIVPAVVNAFRAVGDDTESSTHTRPGRVLKPAVACDGRQSGQSFAISGRTQFGSQFSLGTVVAPNFEANIDLAQVLGPGFFQSVPPPVTLAIWVTSSSSQWGTSQAKFVGQVDLRPLTEAALAQQAQADEIAWKNAEPGACAQQRTDAACAGVMRYLQSMPSGRHATEAQQLLSRLVPSAPVVAVDPNLGRLDRARQAAADAAAVAEEKAAQAAELEAQKAAIKAQEALDKARKAACEDACKREGQKDVDCKASCVREVCQ